MRLGSEATCTGATAIRQPELSREYARLCPHGVARVQLCVDESYATPWATAGVATPAASVATAIQPRSNGGMSCASTRACHRPSVQLGTFTPAAGRPRMQSKSHPTAIRAWRASREFRIIAGRSQLPVSQSRTARGDTRSTAPDHHASCQT